MLFRQGRDLCAPGSAAFLVAPHSPRQHAGLSAVVPWMAVMFLPASGKDAR